MKHPTSSRRIPFNIIDFLLIAVILFSSVAIWYLLTHSDLDQSKQTTPNVLLEYRITVPAIREELQGKAGIGDSIWIPDSGKIIGEVIDVTYAPATIESIDRTSGQQIFAEKPGYLSVILTVQVEAQVQDGFYRTNEYEFQLGRQITFCLPDLMGTGTLTSLTVTDSTPTIENEKEG